MLLDGQALTLTLTVRLATPGDACVAVSSQIALNYPGLTDEIAVRLDDRLYDGLYDGLAAAEGPLPPERLRMQVLALDAEPPLATILTPVNWNVVRELGDQLATLAAAGVLAAWPLLSDPVQA